MEDKNIENEIIEDNSGEIVVEDAATDNKPNKSKKLIIVLFIIVLLVAAVIVVLKVCFKDKKHKASRKIYDSQLEELINAKRTKKAIKVLGDDYTYHKWEDDGAGEETDGWYFYSNIELDGVLYENVSVEKYLTTILCDIDLYKDSISEDDFQLIIHDITRMYGDKYTFEEYDYKTSDGYTCDYRWENKRPYIWIQYGETEEGQYAMHMAIENYY